MPDVHRYWAGAVEQRLHDYWQNVAVDDKQRRLLMWGGPSGTEELCCAGIGIWACGVCSWFVQGRPANEARYSIAADAAIRTDVCDGRLWGGVSSGISTRLPLCWCSSGLIPLTVCNYQNCPPLIRCRMSGLTMSTLATCQYLVSTVELSSLAMSDSGLAFSVAPRRFVWVWLNQIREAAGRRLEIFRTNLSGMGRQSDPLSWNRQQLTGIWE